MTNHPHDLIPAFVLGALDAEEAANVRQHIDICTECRAEAASFQRSIAGLPHTQLPHEPPPHVKRRLMARVVPPVARWLRWARAGSLLLALLFGAIALQGQARIRELAAELQQRTSEIAALQQQLSQQQQLARFVVAPNTLERGLSSPNQVASATMYMQPNSTHAVLIVRGLPPAASGTTYQFWLANAAGQVPSDTFQISADGTATLAIDAPTPVNDYQQVMVTVEQAGGSQHPSDMVVLSGVLG